MDPVSSIVSVDVKLGMEVLTGGAVYLHLGFGSNESSWLITCVMRAEQTQWCHGSWISNGPCICLSDIYSIQLTDAGIQHPTLFFPDCPMLAYMDGYIGLTIVFFFLLPHMTLRQAW
jgi:hypothetical protein